MNRIDETLTRLNESKKKMLSPYITAGDPEPDFTVSLMHALVEGGADALEIGVPFSDPMAEGPVIQGAMERALAHGVCMDDVLNMVAEFRTKNTETPIILMGYLNPIEQYGYETFIKRVKQVGVDGTILVDLPPEESETVAPLWEQYGVHAIYLCSPTTSDERMSQVNRLGSGYLYYVSLKGVTGSNALDLESVKHDYSRRKAQSRLPLMVGFGIKTPEIAARIAQFADGVIVGAALIDTIHHAYKNQRDPLEAGKSFIAEMRQAMDNHPC
ncbi:tryptophan synthase subunit alpha [Legionella impletisoli]|uniref:Tryptophan synthase alpha chain n=1 Tax=Legionella impletisoli TaxID=343510 RepID=A0A917N9I8_9GAMM|nr:tryptophan synthase subunit alpha [Legionella impletisoli]GGI80735.1 tryptophan synthase alpha chain [Legionella impletisoli]